eukprot:355761-Chlamydomonas_euryale.AAC.4
MPVAAYPRCAYTGGKQHGSPLPLPLPGHALQPLDPYRGNEYVRVMPSATPAVSPASPTTQGTLTLPAHTLHAPQPLDQYRGNEYVCVMPSALGGSGPAGGLDACGPVQQHLLASANGTTAGVVHLFQADGRLWVTFEMDCPYVLRGPGGPSSGGGAPFSAGLYVWRNAARAVRLCTHVRGGGDE